MKRQFQPSVESTKAIERIQASLRSYEPVHIRVCGEPGIGKTRTVLEATGAPDLSTLVVYWEKSEDFLQESAISRFQNGRCQLLSDPDRRQVRRRRRCEDMGRTQEPLPFRGLLITIYYEYEDSESRRTWSTPTCSRSKQAMFPSSCNDTGHQSTLPGSTQRAL